MLLIPGPVKLTDEIRLAQSGGMINHRGKPFEELHVDIAERLKKLFDSEEAYVLTGSGTLGVETVIANAAARNEKMLCLANGDFGRRFAETARVYTNVIEEKMQEGKGWNLERAKEKIDNAQSAGATVFGLVYNDTSIGLTNKMGELCRYAKGKGMYTVVDAVSAWAAMPLSVRNDSIDFVCTGSQKAIGAAPGLTMVAVGKDGIDRYAKNAVASYYCDLKKHKKFMDKRQTPYTPAVSLFFALQKALHLLEKNGGLERNIARHAAGAKKTRDALVGMGFELLAETGFESNTVTAFRTDKCDEIKGRLLKEYNIEIAGGMGELKGKILRIAHIGNFTDEELDTCFAAMRNILGGGSGGTSNWGGGKAPSAVPG